MWAECWQCLGSDLFISTLCVLLWGFELFCLSVMRPLASRMWTAASPPFFITEQKLIGGSYCTHTRVITHSHLGRFSHTAGQRLHLFIDRGGKKNYWDMISSPVHGNDHRTTFKSHSIFLPKHRYTDLPTDTELNYSLLYFCICLKIYECC